MGRQYTRDTFPPSVEKDLREIERRQDDVGHKQTLRAGPACGKHRTKRAAAMATFTGGHARATRNPRIGFSGVRPVLSLERRFQP